MMHEIEVADGSRAGFDNRRQKPGVLRACSAIASIALR